MYTVKKKNEINNVSILILNTNKIYDFVNSNIKTRAKMTQNSI